MIETSIGLEDITTHIPYIIDQAINYSIIVSKYWSVMKREKAHYCHTSYVNRFNPVTIITAPRVDISQRTCLWFVLDVAFVLYFVTRSLAFDATSWLQSLVQKLQTQHI